MLLWSGQSISLIGSQVTVLALPLVAALTLGANAWQMGVLTACGRAPYLVLGLPAGVWVDRLPRRKVFIACAFGQAATLASIPVAAGLGLLSLALLSVVAFTAGAFAVFADIATLSLVPMVVPRTQLTTGQGALETSQSAAQIAGPALAGWLVQALTAPLAILADAASFLISALAVANIRTQEVRRDPDAVPQRMIRQIIAGARAVFGHRVLRNVTLCTTTHIVCFNAYTAVFVLYLVRDLHLSPAVVGAALSAGAVGGLIGSVAAVHVGARLGLGRTMATAIVATGLASATAAAAGRLPVSAIAVVATAQLLMWFALQIYNVLQVPIRYAVTPEAMHGRVNATIRTTVWGIAPLGALIGGTAGNLIGLRTTLVASGIGAALAALWLIATRTTAIRDLDAAAQPTS